METGIRDFCVNYKEKILLDALNTFGNFTSVEEEFNINQLEVIYEAMDQVLDIANVVGQSEQLVCDCGNSIMTWYGNDDDKKWFCFNCKKEADVVGRSEQLSNSCECDNVETFNGWGNEKCIRCIDCGRVW